ncbi:MAG TPA: class I SAM-dependent methyltransferase [Flavobacteriales bacterium]
MKENLDYISINKKSWNNRTDVHVDSEFYDVKGFLEGKSSLNDIELNLLGDIKGKSILHLQCHLGQDSISLSKLGAEVTGIDLSDKAIAKGKELAKLAGTTTEFICSDVYDLPNHLDKQFDIVHPVVWMFDDDFQKVGYNYFNTGAIVETESGTYANNEAPLNEEYVMWNHAFAEVFTSLLQNDMQLTALQEFDYSPYNCFKHTVEFAPQKYRIAHMENKLPMVYALFATKKI